MREKSFQFSCLKNSIRWGCLRPGVTGLSENIRVRSIVDRFLEHSRIFYYENNGDPKLYVSSGDWMYRNFQKRIEVAFPVEDPAIKRRLIKEILPVHMKDNVKARELLPDATHQPVESAKGKKAYRSQFELIAMTKPAFKSSTTKKGALKLPKFEMVKETETTRM